MIYPHWRTGFASRDDWIAEEGVNARASAARGRRYYSIDDETKGRIDRAC